ncbi:sulfurtransferase TusA family protein [Candidatus Margulisiibacteriota bacterium]
MSENILDCRDQKCPMPIMNLARTVRAMEKDEIVKILSNDIAFPKDVEAWCQMTNHVLESLTQDGDLSTAIIKLKGLN